MYGTSSCPKPRTRTCTDCRIEVVGLIQEMAKQKGCTVSQLALAWLLGKGEHIVPIPGTRNLERVHENLGALQVSLTDDEMNQIDRISPQGIAAGGRFPGQV
ncbi:aldo/keto reductase [Paenibacillus sp. FSL K6-2393]|uniref:aldo/keto reductase n=1 Tax=Paenibacillus sp. FSL K6-2393 TaxID=2921475 RepID=UPI0030FD0BA7